MYVHVVVYLQNSGEHTLFRVVVSVCGSFGYTIVSYSMKVTRPTPMSPGRKLYVLFRSKDVITHPGLVVESVGRIMNPCRYVHVSLCKEGAVVLK